MNKLSITWMALGLLALAGLTLFSSKIWLGEENDLEQMKVYTVKRDSFTMRVTERGVVRPARIAPVISEVSSNQAKIVWLVKEGAKVTEGQVVARFDTKPFIDEVSRAELEFGDAQATLAAASKLLELQKEEENGRIAEAQRKVEIAGIEAQNIELGSGPLQRKQVEQKLKQAERAYRLAKSNLDDMDVLLKKGHASAREFEKSSDAYETAREQLNVATQELNNFDKYMWPKMVREAELLVSAAKSDLQRMRRTAELQIQNRAGQVEKSRRNLENKRQLLERAKRELENCTVKSPADGILLYAELPREKGRRKIQIGDSIWFGQTFLEVPDTSELIIETQVREIDVAKIAQGMSAAVELDAMPGSSFQGEVETIASLASEGNSNAGIRRYYARIRLLDPSADIHVGMSATVDIIHQEISDGLVIPAGAVVFNNGSTMVYLMKNSGPELVPVEIGVQGVQLVQVLSGLDEGDRISSALH